MHKAENLKIIFGFLLLLIVCFGWTSEVMADSDEFSASEYGLKGAFIDKILNYIEWPQDSTKINKENFEIVILGNNDFGDILDKIFKERKIFNKPIVINYTDNYKTCKNPDLIFISHSMEDYLSDILDNFDDNSTFFIGDTEGYGEKGVYLNFYKEDSFLRFELNEKELKEAGFSVSFHLVRIAKIVSSKGE